MGIAHCSFPLVCRLLLIGVLLWLTSAAGGAKGEILDPSAFASLGPLPAGNVILETSGMPQVNGSPAGELFTPSDGGPELAVFTFDGGDVLGAGDTLTATGSRPAVLLFQGTASLLGNVLVSAGARVGGSAGSAGAGPGAGQGNSQGGAGAGYGGAGGNSGLAARGGMYGTQTILQGGSGGGGASGTGGDGSGALQIGALGLLSVGGTIDARGGDGSNGTGGAGGGSGGQLILHAFDLTLSATSFLTVRGGDGGLPSGADGGGGGGGGRVHFIHNADGALANDGFVLVSGGIAGGAPAQNGTAASSRSMAATPTWVSPHRIHRRPPPC